MVYRNKVIIVIVLILILALAVFSCKTVQTQPPVTGQTPTSSTLSASTTVTNHVVKVYVSPT